MAYRLKKLNGIMKGIANTDHNFMTDVLSNCIQDNELNGISGFGTGSSSGYGSTSHLKGLSRGGKRSC